jgi:hypothetical protein
VAPRHDGAREDPDPARVSLKTARPVCTLPRLTAASARAQPRPECARRDGLQ